MKKVPAPLVALALLVSVSAPSARASLYPIPSAAPSTPAAAAHLTANDVSSELSGMTPAALGKGVVELRAAASGPGTISIVLSVKVHGKTVVIGSARRAVSAAGALEVPFKLTRAGASALAGHAHLKITVAVVFHPQHGPKKTAKVKASLE